MIKQLYKFGQYPLITMLNQDEGMIGVDSYGNLIQIEKGKYMQKVKTPLIKDFNVEGLNFQQANLLFIRLSNKYYKQYGIELYKNQLKFK